MQGIQLQAQAPATTAADLGYALASQIVGRPMAMVPQNLDALVEAIASNRFTLSRNRDSGARITEKGTAIVELHGMLINRSPFLTSFYGLAAYEGLAEVFRRLATDKHVKRIVLDVDSPGGMVTGTTACSDALEALAKEKPVHAIAHDMAASAGYWLACIAQELSVTPDGIVGSIGVRASQVSYAEALERSGIAVRSYSAGAAKVDGAYFNPLKDGEAAETNFEIDRIYDRFVEHVAKHRPLSVDQVRKTDARCFAGSEAVSAGLADRVETLEELVERVEKGSTRVVPKRKANSEPGSKAGGRSPAERIPAAPDDETPSVGILNKGARLMNYAAAADDNPISALATAIAGIAAGARQAQPAPAVPAAPAAAVTKPEDIVAAERSRFAAVLACDEAKERPKLALHLAEAGMSAEAAKDILAAAAVETPAAVVEPTTPAAALGGALEKQMAAGGASAGVKPEGSSNAKARPDFVELAAATAKKR